MGVGLTPKQQTMRTSRTTTRFGDARTPSGRMSVSAIAAGLAFGAVLISSGCALHKHGHGSRATSTAPAGLVKPEKNKKADNTACLDCHADLAEEMIAAKHLKKGYGCAACHGDSIAHGEDEANITNPDVLFGRAEVTPFCKLCHPKHEESKKLRRLRQGVARKARPDRRDDPQGCNLHRLPREAHHDGRWLTAAATRRRAFGCHAQAKRRQA